MCGKKEILANPKGYKEGDTIVVTGQSATNKLGNHRCEIGGEYIIEEVCNNSRGIYFKVQGVSAGYVSDSEIELAKPEVKVGDLVVIKTARRSYDGMHKGATMRVRDLEDREGDYRLELLDKSDWHYFKADEFRVVEGATETHSHRNLLLIAQFDGLTIKRSKCRHYYIKEHGQKQRRVHRDEAHEVLAQAL